MRKVSESEKLKESTWKELCRQYGWLCKMCGAVPELGKQFEDNLCDNCKLFSEA